MLKILLIFLLYFVSNTAALSLTENGLSKANEPFVVFHVFLKEYGRVTF